MIYEAKLGNHEVQMKKNEKIHGLNRALKNMKYFTLDHFSCQWLTDWVIDWF